MKSSACVQLASHANHVRYFRQEELFQRRTIRHRSIRRGDASDRTVEIFERLFGNDGGEFAGESADARVFVKENHFVRLLHGIEYGFTIERQEGPEVENLEIDA